ncbi:MAG: YraN family protein [bacterium]
MNKRKKGSRGEEIAARYLQTRGYVILERNYRFERGEIDIVAKDGETLVFVEVKTRSSDAYGEPEDAVDDRKQGQLRTVAEGYLFDHEIENQSCRFDVVAITMKDDTVAIRLIQHAFL